MFILYCLCMRDSPEAWDAEQHSCSLYKLSKGVKGSGARRWVGERGLSFCFMLLGFFYSSRSSFPAAVYLSGGRHGFSLSEFLLFPSSVSNRIFWPAITVWDHTVSFPIGGSLGPWGRGGAVSFYLSLDI